MASTTASVGEGIEAKGVDAASKARIYESIGGFRTGWRENDYRGYDTFDGLNASLVRPLTFETKFLRTVLLQGVRRFLSTCVRSWELPRNTPAKAWAFWRAASCAFTKRTGDQTWADKS